MSIEETINHLSAQKDMFEYALNYEKNKKQELGEVLERIRIAQMQLYRLAKTLRRDTFNIRCPYSKMFCGKNVNYFGIHIYCYYFVLRLK